MPIESRNSGQPARAGSISKKQPINVSETNFSVKIDEKRRDSKANGKSSQECIDEMLVGYNLV